MYTKVLIFNGLAILALLQVAYSQSSTATCATGDASDIDIPFDPTSYKQYNTPGPQVKRWEQGGKQARFHDNTPS
jgi:hypothetical protein